MSVQWENLSMSSSPGWTWVKFVEIWYSSVVMVQTLVQSSIWPSVLHCSNRGRFEGPNWIPQDPTGSNVTMVLAPKLIWTDGLCDMRLGTNAKNEYEISVLSLILKYSSDNSQETCAKNEWSVPTKTGTNCAIEYSLYFHDVFWKWIREVDIERVQQKECYIHYPEFLIPPYLHVYPRTRQREHSQQRGVLYDMPYSS